MPEPKVIFAVKDGELRPVTRFQKAHTRHAAVVWCPFCDYSWQLDKSPVCPIPHCAARLLTAEEAAAYSVPAGDAADVIEAAPDSEVDHGGRPNFGVYAMTVPQARALLPGLTMEQLQVIQAEEQIGHARITLLEAIDMAIKSSAADTAALTPVDDGGG